jgi:hypothetical protein
MCKLYIIDTKHLYYKIAKVTFKPRLFKGTFNIIFNETIPNIINFAFQLSYLLSLLLLSCKGATCLSVNSV